MRHRDLSRNDSMSRKRREIPEKQPPPLAEQRVLPMQLKRGDRIVDASGEYEIIGDPQEHLTTATTMNREMEMTYWLEKSEAELKGLA
jgi:hypothetical protein